MSDPTDVCVCFHHSEDHGIQPNVEIDPLFRAYFRSRCMIGSCRCEAYEQIDNLHYVEYAQGLKATRKKL